MYWLRVGNPVRQGAGADCWWRVPWCRVLVHDALAECRCRVLVQSVGAFLSVSGVGFVFMCAGTMWKRSNIVRYHTGHIIHEICSSVLMLLTFLTLLTRWYFYSYFINKIISTLHISSFIAVYIDIWQIATVCYVLMCFSLPWKVHFWPLKMYFLPQFLTKEAETDTIV